MLVTDSTSALLYKDHGQIYKGDMTREDELAAQTNGYRVFRYTVLWGKTLTHLAQEARQLVGEITTAHPECEVDVVCWWLGNEVCGDYGCLEILPEPQKSVEEWPFGLDLGVLGHYLTYCWGPGKP